MSVFRRYGEVLAPPGVAAAVVASVFGRLSLGMTGLALLLLVREATGSYAAAGAVSASYAVAFAVGAPSRARAADRTGPARVLRLSGVLHPLAFGLLVLLADLRAPVLSMAGAAALVGLTVPPLGAVMRALWGQLIPSAQLHTAYSLESVVVEACFVLGPLLVAGLTVLSPAVAVLASAACAAVGALALARLPVVRAVVPHEARPTNPAGPLVSPVVRACLLNVLWIGMGFGTIEVAVLAFVEEQGGARATAGVVLAVWSLGSILGGLVYGGLHPAATAARQLPVLVGAVSLGAFLPVLSPSVLVLALLLVLSGSTIAPFSACNSMLLGQAAPRGTVTEAFAWNGSMIFGGAAAGTALAGVLVDSYGARAALVATAVTGLLTFLSSLAGLAALRTVRLPDRV
ncbi:MAG: putative transporter [Frankiales bacterium]|nr:putative transporter [Frankiales bacterium]